MEMVLAIEKVRDCISKADDYKQNAVQLLDAPNADNLTVAAGNLFAANNWLYEALRTLEEFSFEQKAKQRAEE